MDTQKYRYIVPVQIRFNDLDGQRHVNNSVYQQYFDIGRAGYLGEIKGEAYQAGGQSVVIASVKTDFLIPIFLADQIQVETRVAKIGRKSITMDSRLTDSKSGEVKATCETIFVGFDYEKQQSLLIPEEMKEQIRRYENG